MRRLFAAYAAVTLVPTLLLGAVLAGLLQQQADRRGLAEGVSKAELLAGTTVAQQLDGDDTTVLHPRERQRLRRSVRLSVADGQVLRLRLRDLRGRVVFSDAGTAAGEGAGAGADDEALAAAHGRTVAELTRLNGDDPGSPPGPRVVEVYLPLEATTTGDRIGVLELYLPYAPIAGDIAHGQRTVLAALLAGLLLLWLCVTAVSASVIKHLRRESAARAYLAGHDQLTGLPNRARFARATASAMAVLRSDLAARDAGPDAAVGTGGFQRDGCVAVALMDLDRFRLVNDALGHANADRLLVVVATRLREVLGEGAVVARLSGDEFGMLVHREAGWDAASALEALRSAVREPVVLDNLPVAVEATIGYAVADIASGGAQRVVAAGTGEEVLLRQAHAALRTAKREHRGVLGYAPDQDVHDASALELVSHLGAAIAGDQLVLHYQPKLDVGTGRFSSVEALVRWQHPVRGLLFPDAFLDAVEQTELIDDLTRWVLREACATSRRLGEGDRLPIAVNVSARNVAQPRFAADVLALVEAEGVEPSALILELTETAIMSDPARSIATLQWLHEAGFGISIDDFGAGQTSLSHLATMPVDELKIDRAFVMRMHEEPRDAAIVRGVVELGHSLGMSVTAEGVETREVLHCLSAMDCDTAQGYLFTRPVPLEDLLFLVAADELEARRKVEH